VAERSLTIFATARVRPVVKDKGYFACYAGDAGSNPATELVPCGLVAKAPKCAFVAGSPADLDGLELRRMRRLEKEK
jgi:hypothetical protein